MNKMLNFIYLVVALMAPLVVYGETFSNLQERAKKEGQAIIIPEKTAGELAKGCLVLTHKETDQRMSGPCRYKDGSNDEILVCAGDSGTKVAIYEYHLSMIKDRFSIIASGPETILDYEPRIAFRGIGGNSKRYFPDCSKDLSTDLAHGWVEFSRIQPNLH